MVRLSALAFLLLSACTEALVDDREWAEEPHGLSAFLVDEPRDVGVRLAESVGGHLRWTREFLTRSEVTSGMRLVAVRRARAGVEHRERASEWVVASDNRGRLGAFHAGTANDGGGEAAWTREAPEGSRGRFDIGGERVVVPVPGGVELLHLRSGETRTRCILQGQPIGQAVFGPGALFLVSSPLADLWVFDPITGARLVVVGMESGAPMDLLGLPAGAAELLIWPTRAGSIAALGTRTLLAGDRVSRRWRAETGAALEVVPALGRISESGSWLLATLDVHGELQVRDVHTGAVSWEMTTGLDRGLQLDFVGPFLVVADPYRTRIYDGALGGAIHEVSGWGVPLAWTGRTLLVEASHVIHMLELERDPRDGAFTWQVRREQAAPLPGSIGTVLFQTREVARSLVYASVLGEIGIIDLEV